jgi:lysophospholipase L1-like esterase
MRGAAIIAVAAIVTVSAVAPAVARAQDGLAGAPGSGGIVFVGSSIFHRWTGLQAQMAPLPIINIAFDGAITSDMLRLVDARVVPLRPKVVAYYCGSNDISGGEPAAPIVSRIRQFIDRALAALPGAQVVFVSINRAPEKQDRWSVVDDVNRQIEQYASTHKRVTYVDVNPALFNADGTPRAELFLSDGLHLRPAAYDGFTRILKPVLAAAFAAQPVR